MRHSLMFKGRESSAGTLVHVRLDPGPDENFECEKSQTWAPLYVTFTYGSHSGNLAVISAGRIDKPALRASFAVSESEPRADVFPWLPALFDTYRPQKQEQTVIGKISRWITERITR